MHPGLTRLHNATFVELGAAGKVMAIHNDLNLWQNIPKPKPKNTTMAAAHKLSKLSPGGRYWFWMTTCGPDEHPCLVGGPSHVRLDSEPTNESILVIEPQHGLGVAYINDEEHQEPCVD